MRRAIPALALLLSAAVPPPIGSAAAPQGGDVSVTVNYTGKGTVDSTHEIWVFLFSSPDVNQKSQPLATQNVTKSGATAVFKNVVQDPVYVLMIYDEKGDYDGFSRPPPPGLPIGTYSADGKAPTPVKPGAKIKTTFNDARRWKGSM